MSRLTLWWTSSDALDREIVDYLASQPDCAAESEEIFGKEENAKVSEFAISEHAEPSDRELKEARMRVCQWLADSSFPTSSHLQLEEQVPRPASRRTSLAKEVGGNCGGDGSEVSFSTSNDSDSATLWRLMLPPFFSPSAQPARQADSVFSTSRNCW